MYLMKVPKFMTIESEMFDIPSYNAPTTDHHSRQEASATFSAFNTAMSTIRWRHSPSGSGELQSNARILRWSDGSLTLQLASDPTQQFEIDGKALAPPQRRPAKPTPTSLKPGQKFQGNESYTYLAVPHESVGFVRVTHKITAGLAILPSATTTDDALEKLQSSLAAAVRGKNLNSDGGIEFVKIDEDPELAKKKAEVAEREKQRAAKRREAAENRDRDRGNRALGRSGLSSSRHGAGGLTAGMLEDDGGGARPRTKAKPRRQRRNSEYSDDEDFGRKRGNFQQDEYDVEDDFIAGSDEEEAVDDEEEEEEEEDEDDGIVEKESKKSPKRSREKEVEPAGGEEDAEGEDEVVSAARTKRRRVVDEDEDDE